MAAASLTFTLLGPPQWQVPGGQPRPMSAQDAVLVALLALEGPQPRDTLAARLWPAADRRKANNNLRQRIKRLRGDTQCLVFTTGAAVGLAADVATDLSALRAAPQENESRDGNEDGAADGATAQAPAMPIAVGEFLAGCEFRGNDVLEEWLQRRRAQLCRVRAEAVAGEAEALLAAGELAAALKMAEAVVALVPEQEHAWRRLMRLHYRRGDPTAAIAAFERFEAFLHEQTGGQPGPETLRLLDTIETAKATSPSAHAVVPVSLVQPPVRVGRAREWDAMTLAWSAGRTFLLLGDAGIGKSRLLSDLARSRPRAAVSDGGRPGDAGTPYALLGRLLATVHAAFPVPLDRAAQQELARIVPGLGPAPQAPARQASLWRGAETLLRVAADAGLEALIADDLHFADIATLEALRWASSSPLLAGLCFGLASRPLDDDNPAAALLQGWLTDTRRPERIALEPLQAEDIRALLPTLGLPAFDDAGLAARLHAHTGGHPLFTLETLKDAWLNRTDLLTGALPSPATVQELLDRRVRELPAEARDLLQVAAIAGDDLTAERAARLLQRELLALNATWILLEKANLLRDLRFAHDLVRDSALRGVQKAVQQALHASLAGLLAADAGVPPGRVAEHWEGAERWPEAGAAWHAAGLAARRAGRLAEQQDLLARAVAAHARTGDVGAQFDALHDGFDGLLLRSGSNAVLAALPALRELARTTAQRLRCQLIQADALIDLESSDEAARVAAAAVEAAAELPDLLPDALRLSAMALVQGGHHEAAIAAARRAREAAAAVAGQSSQQLRAASASAYVLYAAGRVAEALAPQREALQLAEALGDQAEAALAEGSLAALHATVCAMPAAYEHALGARRRSQDLGMVENSTLGCVTLITLGSAAAYLGAFDKAVQALEAAVAMAGEDAVVSARAKARLSLAALWLTLGRSEAARALAADLPDDAGPGMRMQAALVLARAEIIDGGDGRGHLARLGELMDQYPGLPLLQSAWYEWSHQGEAEVVVRELAQSRKSFEDAGWPGMARTLQLREVARLAEIGGEAAIATAAAHAQALLPRIADGLSAKVYPPEGWLILAQIGRAHV